VVWCVWCGVGRGVLDTKLCSFCVCGVAWEWQYIGIMSGGTGREWWRVILDGNVSPSLRELLSPPLLPPA